MRVAREGHQMQQFTNPDIADIKSRTDQIQHMLGGRGEEAVPGADERPVTLVDQITFSIQMRRIRRSHFRTANLSGPSCDMMLEDRRAAFRERGWTYG